MQINIQKRHLFIILALIIFLAGVILVIAINPTTKPNPGHYSNETMININGVDKTLQQAIDAGDFAETTGCIAYTTWGNTSNIVVDVPVFCKNSAKCIIRGFSTVDGRLVYYSQNATGPWSGGKNGDSGYTLIMQVNTEGSGQASNLYDDSASEQSIDKWTLYSNDAQFQDSATYFICPVNNQV